MTVYIDVILIENVFMNYIILYSTGLIYKIKPQNIRIIISSIIGAFYALISYMQITEIYSGLAIKFILSLAMVYIAFNSQNLKILLKQLLMFYLTSFIFGGAAFALMYFINPQKIIMENGIYIGTYPIKIVLLGAILAFTIVKTTFKMIKGKITEKELICKIKVKIFDKTAEVTALMDTGNQLKEPITGESVIVIEKQSMELLIPRIVLDNIDNILKGSCPENIEKYSTKLRVIPFSSLGKTNGMMLGIKPDDVLIETEQGKASVTHAIIGICNSNLTKNGSYTALIGLDIFERSNNNEFIGIAKKQH